MMNAFRMFAALASISLVSGAALGGLFEATYELAENNILKFKKIPAVVDIHETVGGELGPEERAGLEADLLVGKRYVDIGAKDRLLFFVVKKDGRDVGVALEDYGQGFAGKLGVMVGFDLQTDDLVAIGITTMSETPGVGTRVREPEFTGQFTGLSKVTPARVKRDGGDIDAVSGATISSQAVTQAVEAARAVFGEHKAAILEAVAAGRDAAAGTSGDRGDG